jgi:hypothetical protein
MSEHIASEPLPQTFLSKYGRQGRRGDFLATDRRRMFNAALRAEFPGGAAILQAIDQCQNAGSALEADSDVGLAIERLASALDALEHLRLAAYQAIAARYGFAIADTGKSRST